MKLILMASKCALVAMAVVVILMVSILLVQEANASPCKYIYIDGKPYWVCDYN